MSASRFVVTFTTNGRVTQTETFGDRVRAISAAVSGFVALNAQAPDQVTVRVIDAVTAEQVYAISEANPPAAEGEVRE